jgi:hypothetical protein
MSSDAQLVYTVEQVMRLAAIGRTKLYEERNAGRLRTVKRGVRTLILHDDLMFWIGTWPATVPRAANQNDRQQVAA